MKDFYHHNARSIEETVSLLEKQKGKAKLNEGGTDLLGLLKDKVTSDYPRTIINIKSIDGLNYIREDAEGLGISALTRLSAIAGSPLVRDKYKVLAQAAESVANP
jgi:xanthine dehydrogenase YagS FAD-binding subunit